MSTNNSPSVPPPSGVVCNSVLSFVASAQPVNSNEQENTHDTNSQQSQTARVMPPGVKAIYDACHKLYPDQPNPLQVTTKLKYWLGGDDPLDYISMYWNPGNPEERIPPHWHYISFGLSDLHGDGRVHAQGSAGFGVEVSLRAAGAPHLPPLWPPALCQAIARYVFTTGNKLCAGDHITWHRALDGSPTSRLKHLLVAKDPAFDVLHTPHGDVTILQLVGCTGRELRAAQRGCGLEVLKQMADDSDCGGPLLVTVPWRRRSARVQRSAPRATLAGVSALLRWEPAQCSSGWSAAERDTDEPLTHTTEGDRGERINVNQMSTDSFEMSSIERALPDISDTMQSYRDDSIQYFDAVNVTMNAEAASLLPLAVEVRVGAHFTWRGAQCAVSLVSEHVAHALPTTQRPIAARQRWLQILLSDEEAEQLSCKVSRLRYLCESDSESDSEGGRDAPPLPCLITTHNLTITVVPHL